MAGFIQQSKIKVLWSLIKGIYTYIFSPVIVLLAFPLCALSKSKFPSVNVRRIGHLCVELDCLLKETILEILPRYNLIVLSPRGKSSNPYLLSYWKKYVSIISSPLLCMILRPLVESRWTQVNVWKYCTSINTSADMYGINNRYLGRPPLLSLKESDCKRGWSCLHEIGVPQGAWFICVHAREEGYAPGESQGYRNTRIADYVLAMQAIVERGGWVVRMGDPTMERLPKMERVIDYAHLNIRSDWMDVFLGASCKFFLGGSSGVIEIASIFGVPKATVNCAPMATALPVGQNDVGIPKLLWSIDTERHLSFREVLSTPVGGFRFDHLYKEANVCVIDNSPEDILAVVEEMLDRIDGRFQYTEEDEHLQAKFKALLTPDHYCYGAMSRIGRGFLEKHMSLLNDQTPGLSLRSEGHYEATH